MYILIQEETNVKPSIQAADVLGMHIALISRYGGAPGVRDPGGLEAALFRPQTGYYGDVVAEVGCVRLRSSCSPVQKPSLSPKCRDSRRPVLTVMGRLSATISLTRCAAKASAEVRDALFIDRRWFKWRQVERATHEASTPAPQ